MKNFFYVLLASTVLSSCAPLKVLMPKGEYPATPIIQTTDKSFEKVWDNVIDYFAQNGIPIKIIDKSSGLIISDKARLTWSFENKKFQLVNPLAFVVMPQILDKYSEKPYKPQYVTGEWNVRIKSAGDKTTVNVNLYNIEGLFFKDIIRITHIRASCLLRSMEGQRGFLSESFLSQCNNRPTSSPSSLPWPPLFSFPTQWKAYQP